MSTENVAPAAPTTPNNAPTPELPLNNVIGTELDTFEANISGAEQALTENEGQYSTYNFPPGYSPSCPEDTLKKLSQSGEYNDELFVRYLALSRRAWSIFTTLPGYNPKLHQDPLPDRLQTRFDPAHLQRIWDSEGSEGSLHDLLSTTLGELTNPEINDRPDTQIEMLQRLQGLPRALDLLRPSEGDPFRTKIRQLLLSQKGLTSIRIRDEGVAHVNDAEVNRNWLRECVLTTTSITDPEIADGYAYGVSHSVTFNTASFDLLRMVVFLDGWQLPDHLRDAQRIDALTAIREFNGIFALEIYSEEQLQRTALLATGDPDEIARLKEHDVTASTLNMMGDKTSGRILRGVPRILEDEGRRTVFSEFQHPHDILRFFGRLHALGIDPSRLVIGLHGDTGMSPIQEKPPIGQTRGFMHIASIHTRAFVDHAQATSGKEQGFDGFSLHNMRGFGRIIDEYMQPSRGLDDAETDAGQQKDVIVISCLAAAETNQSDYDPEIDEKAVIGTSSVITRLAADLANTTHGSAINVYGANVSIKIGAAPRSILFTDSDGFGHKPTAVTKLEVRNGTVSRQQVPEIVLRKYDRPVTEADRTDLVN